jgi:ribosomal protein S18 acetylase RimI-like enzyme
MSAYRFCRTDDIGLLVDALNRCWFPHFPDKPLETPVTFKRAIRDLQVWCSSCMVAFAGSDPIGVLIGAKRLSGTLIHKIAVHPDHCRQGHGRHLLTSLSSKLAILGPPRMVAEVPETLTPACELFKSCGYLQDAVLTDYDLPIDAQESGVRAQDAGGFVIPVTVEDLVANGLLADAQVHVCWERSVETLTARKGDIAGIAIANDERIEAYLLYIKGETAPESDAEAGRTATEIMSLRSTVDGGGAHLKRLIAQLRRMGSVRIHKVHPAEIATEILESIGFRRSGRHLLYAAKARSS